MSEFAPGQVVTVFRSRLRPESQDEYYPVSAEMTDLAATMPGLIDVKSFTAEDGERVTLVTFADEESQRAWREHARHRVAQGQGRQAFYSEYSLQVCTTVRARRFTASSGGE
jgi:heme-degrading monooxygenase HmoA